jgi:hypothetical protein
MSKSENVLKDKLDEIRRRLMGNPSKDELNEMQLQLDTMEKWARIDSNQRDYRLEHHDHMDDHVHIVE